MSPTLCRPALLAALALSVSACASSGTTSSNNSPSGNAAVPGSSAVSASSSASGSPSSSRDVITESELPTSGTETAYDAISRLRPDFLRVRPAQTYNLQPQGGASGPAPAPALIVNGQRTGELSDLRHIPATSLRSVRYYSIEQAKRKFGMQYAGGAIEIAYK
jgi:hypothetical protein